ncbi:Glutamate receptor-like protein [Quillaja saponaria]|uniref:Glutamate receptor-like protein n=1 Tax=Quillaja saponaria TaxID=32244 RepID=A0AAD7PI35_QUISA|nr:Glutamate receptor-like protein [Quillaja saponaria]
MVWLMLAFILAQSYTANLSSILTLDQLQPSYLSLKELIAKGHQVGYQSDSFVGDQLLVQRLKFDRSKVMPYGSITDYHHALKTGNVSAIFDEIPYIKMFLKKYGSKFMMVGPTYRTDGLGFVFPYDSNLTSYFSRAILNVTQSDTMDQLEKKYFGNNNALHAQDVGGQIPSDSSSPSLTAYSFAVVLAKAYSQRYFSSRKNTTGSADGSSTSRGHVASIDEENVDEQFHENDHLESPSRTHDHRNQDPERNASSDEQVVVGVSQVIHSS